MASTSSSFMFACDRASRTTGTICRKCSREASSGTTPPYLRCTSTCDATTLDKISRPSTTTAAAVSSQEDSIPRIRVLNYPLQLQRFQILAEFAAKFLVLQSDFDGRLQESELVSGVVRDAIIDVRP